MTVPVPLTLDLWSMGHSASDIARMLGFPNRRHVERIVLKARSIRDPRAVIHAASNGRLIGRPGRAPMLAAVEVGPSIVALRVRPPKKLAGGQVRLFCVAGHERTPENVVPSNRRCRVCKRLQEAARRAAKR